MTDVTQLLEQIESGDPSASDRLLPLVYEQLRKLAAVRIANENPGHTLQATALVHEAYLQLLGQTRPPLQTPNSEAVNGDLGVWRNRGHFFGAASEAMRRILVDSARRKKALKRLGTRQQTPLTDVVSPEVMEPYELLDLDDALTELAAKYPTHAKLVELQFFAGLTQEEAAHCLNISVATARRHWVLARAWLFKQLNEAE